MITKDNIEALIEFGGLLVFKVTVFDELTWKPSIVCRTFNEEHAKHHFQSLIGKQPVKLEGYIVKFDY